MKNLLLIVLLLLTAIHTNANESILRKLNSVNTEWENNPDGKILASGIEYSNTVSFNDQITLHLRLVEATLRARSVTNLTASQKQKRMELLDQLNIYWHSANYPVNDYLSYKNPVFIDRNGTHCAVGYLMQQSGFEKLATAIDRENKFVYVRNIHTPGVIDWATMHGFTISELAWIQPGYPPAFNAYDLSGGLNGSVRALALDSTTGLLYAGGSFTSSTVGMSCNGIAVYMNGVSGWEWTDLAGGVNGIVNCLLFHNNKLYAGGEFTMAGSVAVLNIACYDFASQQWQSLGTLDSSVNALAVYNNVLYAGGKFTGYVSRWTGSQWQDVSQGFLYGEGARALEVWNNTLVIGGNFELATGALRRHVATFDGNYMGTLGFGTPTPVNDFEVLNDTLYAGCDLVNNTDSCAIARLDNFDWNVLLKPFTGMDMLTGNAVLHLDAYNDVLICSGDFAASSSMIYGQNLIACFYQAGQFTFSPMVVIDSAIRTSLQVGNDLIIGGDFTAAMGDTLNHIARLTAFPSAILNPDVSSDNILAYPNPAKDRLYIRILNSARNENTMYRIFNSTGIEMMHGVIPPFTDRYELPLTFSNGMYELQLTNAEGKLIGSKKIVVGN
jgi:hypothetical protein